MNTKSLEARLLLDAKSQLGEGSLWHPIENKLYWIDIENKELHNYDPVTKKDLHFDLPARVGTVVPVKTARGYTFIPTPLAAGPINSAVLSLLMLCRP